MLLRWYLVIRTSSLTEVFYVENCLVASTLTLLDWCMSLTLTCRLWEGKDLLLSLTGDPRTSPGPALNQVWLSIC